MRIHGRVLLCEWPKKRTKQRKIVFWIILIVFWKTRRVNWAKWWPLDRLGWGLRCVWRPDPTFPWQVKEFNTSIKLLPAWLEFSFQHVDHLIYTFRGTENAAMMLWESWSIIRLAIQDPFRSLSSRVTSSFWLFVQRKTPTNSSVVPTVDCSEFWDLQPGVVQTWQIHSPMVLSGSQLGQQIPIHAAT